MQESAGVAVNAVRYYRPSGAQTLVDVFCRVPLVLVGPGLRALGDGGDTTLRADEIRKGGVVVETSGEPVLTPQAAKLGYYLELYRQQADTLTITVRVMDTAGAAVVTAARLTVAIG